MIMRTARGGRTGVPAPRAARFLLAGALLLAGGGLPAGPGRAQDPPPERHELPVFEVPDTVRVEADEMSLSEIIERSVEGEKTKLAGHESMMVTAQVRAVVEWEEKRLIEDAAILVYEEDSGFHRAVRLAEKRRIYRLEDGAWVYDKDEEDDDTEVRVEASDSGEGLASLPFYLEDRSEFSFELLGRYLEDDHVIFEIAFTPRSDFKPLPSGKVYVDTDDFRIIHEEFSFEGHNPFPLLIGGINRISRQWRQLVTGEWVPSRVMAEIDLKGSWLGFIPERVSAAVALEDYRFNQPYDPRIFGER